jgi:hypothetical protein
MARSSPRKVSGARQRRLPKRKLAFCELALRTIVPWTDPEAPAQFPPVYVRLLEQSDELLSLIHE